MSAETAGVEVRNSAADSVTNPAIGDFCGQEDNNVSELKHCECCPKPPLVDSEHDRVTIPINDAGLVRITDVFVLFRTQHESMC